MPVLFLLFSVLELTIHSAPATSVALKVPSQKSLKTNCTLSAYFLDEKSNQSKVFWEFNAVDLEKKNKFNLDCPHQNPFRIFIPSGQFSKKLNQFLYPEYIRVPEKEKLYDLNLIKLNSNYYINHLQNGMTAVP